MNAEELKIALRVALDAGYRLIDTAAIYQNEHVIGEVRCFFPFLMELQLEGNTEAVYLDASKHV